MTNKTRSYSATLESSTIYERRGRWAQFKLAARKSPYTARFGISIITIYVIVAVFAPMLAQYGEAEVFPNPYEQLSQGLA